MITDFKEVVTIVFNVYERLKDELWHELDDNWDDEWC